MTRPYLIQATPRRTRTMRRMQPRQYMGDTYNYDLMHLYKDYGQPQMGDLFNDIMGAVVPKWDQRPDWMKSIKINPDPIKLAQTAAKVLPPKEVGRVVDKASKYGINLAYKTPAGTVPITGNMVAGGYQNFPAIASFGQAVSNIPMWAYLAGGAGIILLVIASRK